MPRHTEKGFTLMEMVITLSLIAILAGIAAPYMGNGAQAYNNTANGMRTIDKLRYTSERLARELREIQRDSTGSFDIATPVNTPGNNITFRKSDNTVVTINDAAPVLNIRYDTLSNTYFVLTDELIGLSFDYYLADGITPANNNNDIAYIEFEVILSNGNNYSQHSRVALRNQL